MPDLRVLIAASEAVPFAKTGGLADVAGSLNKALRRHGVDSRLVMPMYRTVRESFELNDTGIEFRVPMGMKEISASVYSYADSVYMIRADEFFDRDGLYGDALGEFEDNSLRYIFFCRAVLETARAIGFSPHVIHCNDWHTGLVPIYAKTLYRDVFPEMATLMSIHNMGYQGLFPAADMALTGLAMEWFTPSGIEFYGKLNMLKAGLIGADALGTVSVKYAREIATPEYGWGLEGVIRNRVADMHGIVNGIDYAEYDPMTDPAVPKTFGPRKMAGKRHCKMEMSTVCGFSVPDAPVACIVSRLSYQKGMDVFSGSVRGLVESGLNIAVLGSGEDKIEASMAEIAARYPGRFFFRRGYDERLSRLFYAGSDMIVIPSRYEPCGLTQMIAMRYGTVPVARSTGGLADTIEDYEPVKCTGTGFLFEELNASSLTCAIGRALCVYSDTKNWNALRDACMRRDFSWDASAGKYIELYETLRNRRQT